MAKLKGTHLLENLEVDEGAEGVFGICYSVLTWTGVGKGFGFGFSSLMHTMGKLFEDGHATTFLIDLSEETLTMTGMSDDQWVFDEDGLQDLDWARETTSATTYVYYVSVDQAFIDRYGLVQRELEGSRAGYALLAPNLPWGSTNYQNCVSHSHHLMEKLGLLHWTQTKGWWMPSASNWADWFKSFIPRKYKGHKWKYKRFSNTNTHIPD